MLIAEDILLLLTDDETGKSITDSTRVDYALAGAVLLELAEHGKVDVAGPDGPVKKGRLYVRDPAPTGSAELDAGLAVIAEKDRRPQDVVGKLAKGLRDRLLNGLASRGVLRREQGKILGLFPTTRWPAADSAHEQDLRGRLHAVLVVGSTPDPRTAAVISLLWAIDAVPKVVAGLAGVDKRMVKQRAKAIAKGEWASDAVRKAVEAVNQAVMTAVVAASAAGSASGSS
ncbi:GOLPH3/VPS74 family protein [Flindersiella endophytica]